MNFFKAIVAAGLVAASTSAIGRRMHHRRRRDLYLSRSLSKWADAYKTDDRQWRELPVDRLRRRHQADPGQDRDLRRDRRAAEGRRSSRRTASLQWPMIMGAIVPVVNVEGVKAGEHGARGETLADIFLGKITKWDDPAIKKLNPKLKLPSAAIAVVHRSDGSGTTFNFTNYLSKVSADWKSKVGAGTAVEWPAGVGAKGNEGVSGNVDADQGLDRLCRICLRQAEQADLRRADQQGRQDRAADQSPPSRRRPPTPTGRMRRAIT